LVMPFLHRIFFIGFRRFTKMPFMRNKEKVFSISPLPKALPLPKISS